MLLRYEVKQGQEVDIRFGNMEVDDNWSGVSRIQQVRSENTESLSGSAIQEKNSE